MFSLVTMIVTRGKTKVQNVKEQTSAFYECGLKSIIFISQDVFSVSKPRHLSSNHCILSSSEVTLRILYVFAGVSQLSA